MYSSIVVLPPKLEAVKTNGYQMMIYIFTPELYTVTWI